MSSPAHVPQGAHDDDPDQPTGRSTGPGRRRGRLLIPGVFVGVILLLILFMVLVAQLNQ